jgi:hypothetical protein
LSLYTSERGNVNFRPLPIFSRQEELLVSNFFHQRKVKRNKKVVNYVIMRRGHLAVGRKDGTTTTNYTLFARKRRSGEE